MEIGGRRTVDLRSDTVTKPSAAMYRAMTTAEVDDDCSGNGDPTARLLELEMASRFRKEASLFVPSGTMANLISVLIHCDSRGSEIIVGNNSHIHLYENGGISVLGGIHSRTVPNNADGTIDIELLRAAIREPNDIHFPVTKLICLENTHASCGGKCITAEYTDIVGDLAKEHGLKLHIDGARIFNASVALDVPVDRLVRAADSVSVCMSKGLGAPVGSLILGSKDFISKAKKLRKTLGGGMRQIGVLCAAALVGLHDNVPKLIDDHIHAMLFASGLSLIQGIVGIRPHEIQTNMVFFDIAGDLDISPKNFLQLLSEEHGIIATLSPTMRIRAVFHYQITEDDVHYILASIKKTIQQIRLDASSKLIYEDCNTMDTSSKLIYHS